MVTGRSGYRAVLAADRRASSTRGSTGKYMLGIARSRSPPIGLFECSTEYFRLKRRPIFSRFASTPSFSRTPAVSKGSLSFDLPTYHL